MNQFIENLENHLPAEVQLILLAQKVKKEHQKLLEKMPEIKTFTPEKALEWFKNQHRLVADNRFFTETRPNGDFYMKLMDQKRESTLQSYTINQNGQFVAALEKGSRDAYLGKWSYTEFGKLRTSLRVGTVSSEEWKYEYDKEGNVKRITTTLLMMKTERGAVISQRWGKPIVISR